MTDESHKTEVDFHEWRKHVAESYGRAFIPLGRAISSILGLWALAYLLGWKRADSYFTGLGADWLTSQLTLLELQAFSYWPVFAFAAGLLLTFADISDRPRILPAVWIFTSVIFTVLFSLGIWFSFNNNYVSASTVYFILLLPLASIVGLEFGELALIQRHRDLTWTSKEVWKVCFLGFWFLSSVAMLGSSEGKRDAQPSQTKLNIVETMDGETFRLLLAREGHVYAVKAQDGESPKIAVLSNDRIRYIHKPNDASKASIDKHPDKVRSAN